MGGWLRFLLLGGRLGIWGVVLLLAFLLVQCYFWIRSDSISLDPERARAADALARAAADALSAKVGTAWAGAYVKVARLAGDAGGHFRGRIQKELVARTNCQPVSDSVWDELREQGLAKGVRLGAITPARAEAWRAKPVASAAEAVAMARGAGSAYVVYGSVDDFRSAQDGVHAKITLGAVDAAQGATLFEQTFEQGDGGIFADMAGKALGVTARGFLLRLAILALAIGLLPVLSAPFWTALLDRESNAVNVLCWLVQILVDLAVAWVILGLLSPQGPHALVYLMIGTCAAIYDLFILSLLERTRVKNKFAL